MKIKINFLCLLAASVISLAQAQGAEWQNTAVVATAKGSVQGFEDNYTTWTWKAIPFTKPPTGELRWKAPQDPDPWTGTLQNQDFCSMCPQTSYDNTSIQGSEDCLYLNIWRPRTAEKNLPVYFWIYGGSEVMGSADPYIGAPLAGRQNMVVVTINYRLGLLGWFTHPALREGLSGADSSGNWATLDIIKALSWVHDNIETFGGDPGNVTTAGQSAGGINVLSLMMSQLATGLFHRGIVQSGGLSGTPVADGDTFADKLIEALLVLDGTPAQSAAAARQNMSNAEIRDYLRGKTVAQLFAAASGLRAPYIFTDGTVIPAEGADVFKDPNKYNRVPLIMGTNSEEGKLFLYLFGLADKLGNPVYQLLGGKAFDRLTRKLKMDPLAYQLSRHENQPVYCYSFQYGQYRRFGYNAWPTDTGPTDRMSWAQALGACHGLDLPFNFGLVGSFPLFAGIGEYIFRQDNRAGQLALSDAMMNYNGQFARTGDPNIAGQPQWTTWPKSRLSPGPRFMSFDANDTEAILKMIREVR